MSDSSRPKNNLCESNLLHIDQLHSTQVEHASNINFGHGMWPNKVMEKEEPPRWSLGPWRKKRCENFSQGTKSESNHETSFPSSEGNLPL